MRWIKIINIFDINFINLHGGMYLEFEKIVKDLEFIDGKLVQLQKVYNHEVHRWNKVVKTPGINILSPLFKVYPFDRFN